MTLLLQRYVPHLLLLQNPGNGFPLSSRSFLKKYHHIDCCRCLSKNLSLHFPVEESSFGELVQRNRHRDMFPSGTLSLSVCSKDCQRPTRADVLNQGASLLKCMHPLAEAGLPEASPLLHCLLHSARPISFLLTPAVLRWPEALPPKATLPCYAF